MKTNLHDVTRTCGIDSDAGMSISTLADDFIWLDKSPEALGSLAAPTGINGGSSVMHRRSGANDNQSTVWRVPY
jgi:hypothetical protein